jgi:hypothetical protein
MTRRSTAPTDQLDLFAGRVAPGSAPAIQSGPPAAPAIQAGSLPGPMTAVEAGRRFSHQPVGFVTTTGRVVCSECLAAHGSQRSLNGERHFHFLWAPEGAGQAVRCGTCGRGMLVEPCEMRLPVSQDLHDGSP